MFFCIVLCIMLQESLFFRAYTVLEYFFKRVQSLGACDITLVSGTFVCVCVFHYTMDTTANTRVVKGKT